jgi:hypothetical protein
MAVATCFYPSKRKLGYIAQAARGKSHWPVWLKLVTIGKPAMFITDLFFKKSHIGISLGQSSVRLVRVNARSSVSYKREAALEAPLFSMNAINKDALIASLKNLRDGIADQMVLAAITIPEKFAYTREYVLPKIPLPEVGEAINWQIEKIFPFSSNEIYFDWKLLKQSEKETRVLVVAMQRKWLDELREALLAARFMPVGFEPSASAISRLVPEDKAKRLIIVELEKNGATSTLVINGVSSLTSTISFDVTSTQFSVQLIEALQQLVMHASKDDLPGAATLQLLLAGEAASPQIADYLGEQLNLSASVLEVKNLEPSFHLAYVAAKGEVLPPESAASINLLPEAIVDHYRSKSSYIWSKRLIGIVIALSLPSIGLALALFIFTQFQFATIQKKVEAIKASQATAAPVVEMSKDSINIPVINRLSTRFATLFPQKTTPQKPLSIMLGLIPSQITIVNMSFDSGKQQFTITGIANQREDLIELRNKLEESGQFAKIALPLSSFSGSEQVEFTLEFNYTPPKEQS